MLRQLAILFFLISVSYAGNKEVQSLLSSDIEYGYWGASEISIIELNDEPTWTLGLDAAIVFERSFSIGLFGKLVGESVKHDTDLSDSVKTKLDYKVGGILLEYTLFRHHIVHLTFPFKVGYGVLEETRERFTGVENGVNAFKVVDGDDPDGFMYYEFGLLLEANITNRISIGLGATYNQVDDVSDFGVTDSNLNSLNYVIQLKSGLF